MLLSRCTLQERLVCVRLCFPCSQLLCPLDVYLITHLLSIVSSPHLSVAFSPSLEVPTSFLSLKGVRQPLLSLSVSVTSCALRVPLELGFPELLPHTPLPDSPYLLTLDILLPLLESSSHLCSLGELLLFVHIQFQCHLVSEAASESLREQRFPLLSEG